MKSTLDDAYENGIMCINGQQILFRGVKRHEFSCKHGRAIGEEEMLWDIRFMKRHNLNAVRTSHYPNQSLWYKLCDRYGIYLIDETNMESHGSWQKLGACEPSWNVPGNHPEWQACVLDRANSMFQRDKNHPAILIWSCGNESYAGERIANMTKFFHESDPTRLVHCEGCFWNREYDHCSDMESRMYAKPQEIDQWLATTSEKPYISCEFLYCMGNSGGGLKLYMDLEEKYERYQGGFIWDYIDQAVEAVNDRGERYLAYGGDHDERATDYEFCTNGLVYADRTISPKAQEVKAQFSNVKITPDEQGVLIKEENYLDRMEGARLGIFGGNAEDTLPRYVVPGECGNRMGTRWLAVTDDDGHGLCFEAVDIPFQQSVLPYSCYELENAMHAYELPDPYYTPGSGSWAVRWASAATIPGVLLSSSSSGWIPMWSAV